MPDLFDRLASSGGGTPQGGDLFDRLSPDELRRGAEQLRELADKTRKDARRDAVVTDLASNDGFLDAAGDYLQRGRYRFEAGADRVVGTVASKVGATGIGAGMVEAARRKEAVADTAIEGQVSLDDVKRDPLRNVLPFVGQTGVESLPGMAIAATGLGGLGIFAGSQAGNIGQERARNDGRDDATLGDIGAAAPAAIASAALERTGISGILGSTGRNAVTRAVKAGATEALTEAGQSSIEYAGGSVGTEQGFDVAEMGDQALGGALGGFGVGASLRAGGEGVVRVAGSRLSGKPVTAGIRESAIIDQALPTDADRASPLPTDLVVAGKATVASATSANDANAILTGGGLPSTSTRVSITMPGGETKTGTITDAFVADAGDAPSPGVKIELDGGGMLEEHFDTLADAGVTIAPIVPSLAEMTAEADAIDARLADQPSAAPVPLGAAVEAPATPPTPAGASSNLPVDGPVTSPYGARKAPKKGASTQHGGIDIGVPVGTPVRAPAAGTVLVAGKVGKNGNLVRIDHGNGVTSAYAHLDGFDVKPGDRIEAGQTFARSGNTGNSTGPHLHYAVRKGMKDVDPSTLAQLLGEQAPGGNSILPVTTEMPPAAVVSGEETAASSPPLDQAAAATDMLADPAAELPPIEVRHTGREDIAVTGSGREVPVRYALVEAASLIASNDAEGNPNPRYPANLQPRDRTRAVSQTQVTDIAANLNPRLLGPSPKASDGAPIISPAGVVESGNGRTLALQRAYAAGGPQADAYRAYLGEQGFDATGMAAPVLVRVRGGDMAPADVEAFTREANARDTLGYSSTEQAMSDAASLTPDTVGLYRGGDLDAAGNRDFVRSFLRSVVSPTDYATMVAADGSMSQTAMARVRGALLARAYGSTNIVTQATESTDSDIKTITGALTDVAGRWSQMVEAARAGSIDPAMDITAPLSAAVELVDRARREGKSVADLVGQRDMFGGGIDKTTEALLRLFFNRPDFTRPNGRAKVSAALNVIIDEGMKTAPGGGLFGEETKATPDAIVGLAKEKISDVPRSDQPDLLAAAPAGRVEPGAVGDRESAPAPGVVDERPDGAGVPSQRGEQAQPDVAPSSTDDAARGQTIAVESDQASIRKLQGTLLSDAKRIAAEQGMPAGFIDDVYLVGSQVSGQASSNSDHDMLVRFVGDINDPRVMAAWDRLSSYFDGLAIQVGTPPIRADVFVSDELYAGKPAIGTRDNPVVVETAADLEAATADIPDASLAQREAGNHRMGHAIVHGLPVTIEIPKGGERRGTGPDGKEWSATLPAAYGYVKRTTGSDGEAFDVFVGDNPASDRVFVIDQVTPATGKFDEHKAVMGADSEVEARSIYEGAFSDGKGADRIGGIVEMDVAAFKALLDDVPKGPVARKGRTAGEEQPEAPPSPAPITETASKPSRAGEPPAGTTAPESAPAASIEQETEAAEERVPLFDDETDAQIGWLDPTTGAITRIDEAQVAAEPETKPEPALQSRMQDAEPVAILTGEELGKMPAAGPLRVRLMRERAIAWYQTNLAGTTVTSSDGIEVQFGRSGRRKSTSLKGDLLLRTVPAIPDIISKGTRREMPSKYASIDGIFYAATVEIAGERHAVGVVVRQDANGRYQYDLTRDTGKKSVGNLIEDQRGARPVGLEVEPDTQDVNLFLLDEDFNSDAEADRLAEPAELSAVWSDVDARLRELGVADRIASSVVASLGRGVSGQYFNRVVTVALESTQDRRFTVDHEAIHALRDMDLFLPAEWRSLEAAARADKAVMGSIRKRYPDLDETGQVEEAIADRFARWAGGDKERGFVAKAFERVRDVLRAIGQALRGNGFTTAESVMRAVDSGNVGTRARNAPVAAAPRQSRTDDASIPGIFARDTTAPRARQPRMDLAGGGMNGSTTTLARAASSGPLAERFHDAFDVWRARLQDRMLPLLRTQQAAERDLGRPLDERENPYIGEELMTGRIGAQLERLADDMVEPLFQAVQAEGATIAELESYLYARHAPERNARISAINPEFGSGEGSGMTDLEATAILNRVEAAGKTAAMERLAARVDALLKFAVDTRVEAGLLSEADARAWRDTYQFYVPLRGQAEMEGATGLSVRPSKSSGVSVAGKESKRAFGRRSQAEDILAYSIMQAEEAIARAETNRVAQQFHALAQAAPDPDFWKIDKVERRAVWNKATGQVEYRAESRISGEDAPYTVSLKIDGVEHRVTMNRRNAAAARLADAMRNLTAQQTEWVVRTFGTVNRFLSAVNTSYNPEFVITNAFRDIQTAGINLAQFDQKGLIAGVLKDYPKAMAASVRGAFKTDKGEWGKVYREFVGAGGRVYFNNVEDLDGLKARVEREFRQASDKAMGRISVRRGFDAFRSFIENANNGVENAIRLSAFKNARERGLTTTQAASLAKNLTVNFNRRGSWGSGINAAYLFFNASVQGTAVMLTAMKSRRVQKVLAGAVTIGVALEILNAMISGDDEDGEAFYDKISDFDKQRNLIVMVPGGEGDFIKIPLPYGYNAFFGMGRSVAEVARRGGDRWQDSVAGLMTTVIDAFNPVGGTESLLNFISPTIVDPVVDLMRNRDYADRPIMPERSPYAAPGPDAQRYFGGVGPQWKAVTDTLTDLTGGDDVQPGAIDVSPETLEHLFGVVTGAAGSFLDRNAGTVLKLADPVERAEIGANDVPLARKVLGSTPSWYATSAFYERARDIEASLSYAKDYAEREDTEALERLVARDERLLSLEPAMKAARKELRAIRKERAAGELAHELGKIDDAAWQDERALYKEASDAVILEFNTKWNAVMQPAERR